MEPIGRELEGMLRRLGPGGAVSDLVRVWPDAVGDGIAQNAWPARLARDGTLHVSTSSAAWAFELTHLEASIATRLAEALGGRAPKRLRFAPGLLPDRANSEAAAEPRRGPRPGTEDRARAARLTAGIADAELRSLVARAAAASLARSGSGRSL
jgi:hypothetical protein